MPAILRLMPLALLVLPLLSHAQAGGSAIGLEIPAPTPPSKGHFLTGAYMVGAYSPLPTTGGYGYGMQPFLRYQLGTGDKGRLRPYVQYSFAPYRMPTYGAGQFYGADMGSLPANPGFAPLAVRNSPYGALPYGGYGGLGSFSVGIPMRIGNGSAMLNVGGSIVGSLLGGGIR
ncbi:hypothetical protein [Hymenobacter negativus]|uniref:Uncharacterized protein n=1 Tax=Hymenobacter negativus TaxID=2795026 RepID=A0ABS3QHC4_9BACT|nr:hypothetical protein [Hymenobacter negativus]MBO2010388.1 hypothetical protein [Hymenobacter negativus]